MLEWVYDQFPALETNNVLGIFAKILFTILMITIFPLIKLADGVQIVLCFLQICKNLVTAENKEKRDELIGILQTQFASMKGELGATQNFLSRFAFPTDTFLSKGSIILDIRKNL